MAPPQITDDYYMILKVEQTASSELITKSYKRLAKELHPDRNTKHDATKAFQLLGQAYDTLKDESKRRDYDLIYPSIRKKPHPPHNPQPPRSSYTSTPQTETLSEVAQIAALVKSTQERAVRWRTRKFKFDSTTDELRRDVQRLQKEIKLLDVYEAAEAAAEAQKNSWTTWMLSSLCKPRQISEEEKELKDRQRQEKMMEKNLKERKLQLKNTSLQKEEALFKTAMQEMAAANSADNKKIRLLRENIQARERREAQEKERVERERQAKIRREQEEERVKRELEAAMLFRTGQAESERREKEERQKRQREDEEESRKWRELFAQPTYPTAGNANKTTRKSTSACTHGGWWDKVHGRTSCPRCCETWTYLLKCPGCITTACPKCQSMIRPRGRHHTARPAPTARTLSPDYNPYWG